MSDAAQKPILPKLAPDLVASAYAAAGSLPCCCCGRATSERVVLRRPPLGRAIWPPPAEEAIAAWRGRTPETAVFCLAHLRAAVPALAVVGDPGPLFRGAWFRVWLDVFGDPLAPLGRKLWRPTRRSPPAPPDAAAVVRIADAAAAETVTIDGRGVVRACEAPRPSLRERLHALWRGACELLTGDGF